MRFVILALALSSSCSAPQSVESGQPPGLVLGNFVDDYDVGHHITRDQWRQASDTIYRIVAWGPDHLIAQNAASNPSDGELWTRIDWLALDDPKYPWAFCLSAYKAPTRAAAEASRVARRDTPKTGCNGFPFSRMRVR